MCKPARISGLLEHFNEMFQVTIIAIGQGVVEEIYVFGNRLRSTHCTAGSSRISEALLIDINDIKNICLRIVMVLIIWNQK